MKNIITGLSGSIRSRMNADRVINTITNCRSFEDLFNLIYKEGGDRKISNSEALLVAALYGAIDAGSDIKYFKLKDLFPLNCAAHKPSIKNSQIEADGYIISSPVYFGDRSSLIADWLKSLNFQQEKLLPLDGKAAGVVSVGAKRNGGQETTNIFFLSDVLEMGAAVVGNGPPTSQYGGTGWAGHMGTIIDDNFGLMTSMGTGQRVSILSKCLNIEEISSTARILFLVTCKDKHKKLIRKIESLPFSEKIELKVLDISELHIHRCIACNICPNGNLESEYKCIIPSDSGKAENDDMRFIQHEMVKADTIVLTSYNGNDAGKDNYQPFIERTRCLRRDNYVLSDRLFSVFVCTSSMTDITHIRALSSFLRHNMFILGPFYKEIVDKTGDCLDANIGLDFFAKRLELYTLKMAKARRSKISNFEYLYKPIGYTS
ncbi:MAG: hypothetical protein HF978_14445 [Desulfobacteraceae bacterium]|nr:NAD(P)H-dependent oxidoreductase [Desulfobacteraceae bacterium]MBC2756739.1 hypothetical protein [Desulfobacteraceae bacterium]